MAGLADRRMCVAAQRHCIHGRNYDERVGSIVLDGILRCWRQQQQQQQQLPRVRENTIICDRIVETIASRVPIAQDHARYLVAGNGREFFDCFHPTRHRCFCFPTENSSARCHRRRSRTGSLLFHSRPLDLVGHKNNSKLGGLDVRCRLYRDHFVGRNGARCVVRFLHSFRIYS